MSLNQNVGGGDFITLPKDQTKQPEDKKSFFHDKMEEILKDLFVEEHRLRHLTTRFSTLEDTLTRLKEKVEHQERYLHRKLIDEIIDQRAANPCDCTTLPEKPPVDLMTLDHDLIKEKIRDLTSDIDKDQIVPKDDIDLNRIKSNLEMYRSEISEVKRKEIANKKRHATVKMLKDHLDFIEKKCDHELMKLDNIQQDIRQLGLQDNMETNLEMLYRTNSSNFQTISETPSPSYSFNDSFDGKYLTSEMQDYKID